MAVVPLDDLFGDEQLGDENGEIHLSRAAAERSVQI